MHFLLPRHSSPQINIHFCPPQFFSCFFFVFHFLSRLYACSLFPFFLPSFFSGFQLLIPQFFSLLFLSLLSLMFLVDGGAWSNVCCRRVKWWSQAAPSRSFPPGGVPVCGFHWQVPPQLLPDLLPPVNGARWVNKSATDSVMGHVLSSLHPLGMFLFLPLNSAYFLYYF